jgi:hypothetical protein
LGGELIFYDRYKEFRGLFGKEVEMEYSCGISLGLMNIGACEFHQALQKGRREAFFSQILRRPCCLTPFEAVKNRLNLVARLEKGRQEIRLDQIAGSVGKPEFFTRSLWPLYSGLENRWVSVYELMMGPHGYSPIEVYKVKDRYFILDGHHRASVAHVLGCKTIEACVIEWQVLPT